jgi:hypothetical protein
LLVSRAGGSRNLAKGVAAVGPRRTPSRDVIRVRRNLFVQDVADWGESHWRHGCTRDGSTGGETSVVVRISVERAE